MIKTKIKILSVLLLASALIIPFAFADYLPVAVYATDTVAGYPSALRTSLINPNQDVRFVVEKPDGAVVQIPAQADLEGIAKTDLYGHQTKIAGKYKVAVVYPGSSAASPQSTFNVYPDQVSPTQSTIRATLNMAESGKDVTFLVVTLYDQYRNPVADHLVKLVSSRSEDTIEAFAGGVTDNNGRANFKVMSDYPGVSVFTAMDVTLNMILQSREEVVFFAPTASPSGLFGADIFSANIGGDGDVLPGPVDHFEISDLASTVRIGDELTMTVTALDKTNNVAKNYTGTILISVPHDENAVLPNSGEYTFKAADQGKFTFNLSLQFSALGSQSVQVFDKNNFKIAGEKAVQVVSKESVVTTPFSPDIVIKSPMDGAELASNLILISGSGNENINLKVFDNDVKIGDTATDSDGFFSYEAKELDSGSHVFYVMTEDSKVSKSVSVTIDTIPPVINSFTMDAEGPVVPGTQVNVTVQSEPGLEAAKIRVQGVEQDMTESSSEPGTYAAILVSPAQNGNYPVDVILIDKLANKGEFSGKGTLTVTAPEAKMPPKVESLEGTPGDTLIALTWAPIAEHERPIKNFKIFYGTQMDKLEQTVDTQDSAPQWELRGLTNDTQYFINIKAVDTQGLVSAEPSVTIAVTPVAADLCLNVDCGEHGTCAEGLCTCSEGWSGLTCNVEEVLPPPVTGVTQITAVPYDSAVVLSWPSFEGVQAYYYKVYMGFSPGQYSDYVTTSDNRNVVTITDLINTAPYYFAVAALDINGNQISALSQEVQSTPFSAGLRPAAPSPTYGYANAQPQYPNQLANAPGAGKTGPESLWIVFASVVFAYFLYRHKRKFITKINAK